jgi:hypothetical protein
MSAQDVGPTTHPAHRLDRLPATVPAAAGLLVISAIMMLEHARRLFDGITMAEETLGLAAIRSLRQVSPGIVARRRRRRLRGCRASPMPPHLRQM